MHYSSVLAAAALAGVAFASPIDMKKDPPQVPPQGLEEIVDVSGWYETVADNKVETVTFSTHFTEWAHPTGAAHRWHHHHHHHNETDHHNGTGHAHPSGVAHPSGIAHPSGVAHPTGHIVVSKRPATKTCTEEEAHSKTTAPPQQPPKTPNDTPPQHPKTTTTAAPAHPQQPPPSPQKPTTTAAPTTSAQPKPQQQPPQQPQQPAPQGSNAYQQAVLSTHATLRAKHGVPALTWSDKLASAAEQIGNLCVFEHSKAGGDGNYGQNIAAGSSPADIGKVIQGMYTNEAPKFAPYYGQANPPNFMEWGHFSQIVWKSTTQVGCATVDCKSKGGLKNAAGMAPYFTVCNYGPPGNFGGQYAQNVLRPVK